MKAGSIAVTVPTVTVGDPVTHAVRLMTEQELPGLIVVDKAGRPKTVIPGTQVLRMAVLHAYHDDPALVRTIDEAHADLFWQELGNRSVGDCLPTKPAKSVSVRSDATLLELATVMLRERSPLVAVVDRDGSLVGAVTLNGLLSTLALVDHTD